MQKFLVRRFYSGYCEHEIEAENEDKAYEKSRGLPIKTDEIIETLEAWAEADEVGEIGDDLKT